MNLWMKTILAAACLLLAYQTASASVFDNLYQVRIEVSARDAATLEQRNAVASRRRTLGDGDGFLRRDLALEFLGHRQGNRPGWRSPAIRTKQRALASFR